MQKRSSIYVDDKGNNALNIFFYLLGENMEEEAIFIYCLADSVVNATSLSDHPHHRINAKMYPSKNPLGVFAKSDALHSWSSSACIYVNSICLCSEIGSTPGLNLCEYFFRKLEENIFFCVFDFFCLCYA